MITTTPIISERFEESHPAVIRWLLHRDMSEGEALDLIAWLARLWHLSPEQVDFAVRTRGEVKL